MQPTETDCTLCKKQRRPSPEYEPGRRWSPSPLARGSWDRFPPKRRPRVTLAAMRARIRFKTTTNSAAPRKEGRRCRSETAAHQCATASSKSAQERWRICASRMIRSRRDPVLAYRRGQKITSARGVSRALVSAGGRNPENPFREDRRLYAAVRGDDDLLMTLLPCVSAFGWGQRKRPIPGGRFGRFDWIRCGLYVSSVSAEAPCGASCTALGPPQRAGNDERPSAGSRGPAARLRARSSRSAMAANPREKRQAPGTGALAVVKRQGIEWEPLLASADDRLVEKGVLRAEVVADRGEVGVGRGGDVVTLLNRAWVAEVPRSIACRGQRLLGRQGAAGSR
jgi:hypothetical protein